VVERDERLGTAIQRYVPDEERAASLARLARNWASLRDLPNSEKRVAIILSNYPPKAVDRQRRRPGYTGLGPRLLRRLESVGYNIGILPEDGDQLIHRIIDEGSYDTSDLTGEQMRATAGQLSERQYNAWLTGSRPRLRSVYLNTGGPRQERSTATYGGLMVSGSFWATFSSACSRHEATRQPIAIYHSPDLPPTHHISASTQWIRSEFRAHAVVHMGKHGTMEWLPGKALAHSVACYPDLAIRDLPFFYSFIVNNPGEGTQAKRRTHAVIVDHLIPAMTTADSYNEITRIEQLLDEYAEVSSLDPKKLALLQDKVWQAIVEAQMHRDLHAEDRPDDFDDFVLHVDGYLCELKDSQIRDGLHILGEGPPVSSWWGTLLALTRLDNADAPSLGGALARMLGLDYERMLGDRSLPFDGDAPEPLRAAIPGAHSIQGDMIEALHSLAHGSSASWSERGCDPAAVRRSLHNPWGAPDDGWNGSSSSLRHPLPSTPPNWRRDPQPGAGWTAVSYLRGPSGAPTRGMANVLPRGRILLLG